MRMSAVGLDIIQQAKDGANGCAEPARALIMRRRAVVIDDDDFVSATLTRQLKTLGFEAVEICANGLEAALLLNGQLGFDLIVCDLGLPGADGVQLTRVIAVSHPRTPLILISGKERRLLRAAEELARARGIHLLGSLEKPISNSALQELLGDRELRGTVPLESRAGADPAPSATSLRSALAQDEIIIHTQPILDTSSGTLAGVEVLARWLIPERGLIPPSAFIPVAERNGLIEDLTDRVIRKALGAAEAWKRVGLETRISINMPLSYAQRFSLPDTIGAELARIGIGVDQFGFEITNSCLAEDPLRALDVMTRLRLHGFNLSLDDFGCGESSLNRLRQFPFNEVKIDRSFVSAALVDPEVRDIVQTIVGLARRLGLRAVAKGVETKAHWDLFAELGCDLMQGDLIAEPFPAAQLPSRLGQLGVGKRAA
jgi:EAL domain-containing protein (putative c-di-GMP-specific phosphodiesterase class I)